MCNCKSGERCICAYKKDQSPQPTAAASTLDQSFARTAAVNDSLVSDLEPSAATLPDFLTSYALGHLDDNVRQHVNAPAEYTVHATGPHPVNGTFTAHEPFDFTTTETTARPADDSSSDPYLYQQLSTPALQADLSNTSHLAYISSEPSDSFPDIAPQLLFTDLATTDWSHGQLYPMSNNYEHPSSNSIDRSWDEQQDQICTAIAASQEMPETHGSFTGSTEPQYTNGT